MSSSYHVSQFVDHNIELTCRPESERSWLINAIATAVTLKSQADKFSDLLDFNSLGVRVVKHLHQLEQLPHILNPARPVPHEGPRFLTDNAHSLQTSSTRPVLNGM